MPATRARRLAALLAVPLVLLVLLAQLAACGDDGDGGDGASDRGTGSGAGEPLEGDLTVFAAASLTDAFDDLADAFEAAHPEVDVELNVGPSSGLREQILAGAPAAVFASADTSNMDQVVAAGAADDPQVFATNRLQIVVPAGNPGGVTGLADLADPDLLVGLCAEGVPCGDLGREALADAGVTPSVDTEEADVRALLTKVEAGDLDAGIVYVTDVLAAGDAVEGIAIPEEHNVVATYPIATLTGAGDADVAAAFVALVVSEEGQAILADHGFSAP
ncbi:MAG TPA: molybdate ABC transporter substrate-binding protein [Acidimicrobiales bacterium]